MMTKKKLQKDVWENEGYYDLIEKSSVNVSQPGIKKLLNISKKSKKILDLGCGEGSRLQFLSKEAIGSYGVDISNTAIKKAKRKYPTLNFMEGDLENLPFEKEQFDLVYSAYVFEHLENPERVLGEAKRVLKRRGYLVIIAPNYGAPNRASPPSKDKRLLKLIVGSGNDVFRIFRVQNNLDWNEVKPLANKMKYEMDWDTVTEPYIGSLVGYLGHLDFNVVEWGVNWSEERNNPKTLQKVIRYFGEKGIFPFKFWGPQLVVIAQKR